MNSYCVFLKGDNYMSKKTQILLIVFFCSVCMSLLDAFFAFPYLIRSFFKICLFLGIPIVYFLVHKEDMKQLKSLFEPNRKAMLAAIGLGALVYAVILIAYIIFRQWIDFQGIKESLTSGVGVNQDNFIFVALYISFVNSMLEEFFFRGFGFMLLKHETKPIFAYLFSAFLFAFYHVGMTQNWFSPFIYLLAMLGLWTGGIIFNALNDRFESIYPSWFVHMCANFAINTVGMILFGIL